MRALDLLDQFPRSQIFVIPVRLEECKPDREKLEKIHWADMFPDWEKGLTKILSSIKFQDLKRMTQQDVSESIPEKINIEESTEANPCVTAGQVGEDFNEPIEREDEIEFLFLEDIIDQLPNTNLTLVSLSSYLKLTGQSIKWTNISNNITSKLIDCCETPMLTFSVFVENMFCNPKEALR